MSHDGTEFALPPQKRNNNAICVNFLATLQLLLWSRFLFVRTFAYSSNPCYRTASTSPACCCYFLLCPPSGRPGIKNRLAYKHLCALSLHSFFLLWGPVRTSGLIFPGQRRANGLFFSPLLGKGECVFSPRYETGPVECVAIFNEYGRCCIRKYSRSIYFNLCDLYLDWIRGI